MTAESPNQGPWTRLRPLQKSEIDPYTKGGMLVGEATWGDFPNNLLKVMTYHPGLTQNEVEYANSFIFDPPIFRGEVLEAGFNDRLLKELIISKVSLLNRSRYSITHHSMIGTQTFEAAGLAEEGHQKLLHLHEHENHPDTYTERERVVLDYAAKVTEDAHLVSDGDFEKLKNVLREDNLSGKEGPLKDYLAGLDEAGMDRHVDAQVVEITWLVGHYCLLNRWFTVLQVPDETAADELDFLSAYAQVVPEDIRARNAKIFGDGF